MTPTTRQILVLEYGELTIAQRRNPTPERQERFRAIEETLGLTREDILTECFRAILPN